MSAIEATVELGLGDWASDDGRVALLVGDFQRRLLSVKPGTVDLILTDPPYPADDLSLWSKLSALGAHLLGERGQLFAYSGQLFLPEILNRLGEHLHYGWVFCLQSSTGWSASRIMGRHILQNWKPIVAFSPGPWPSGRWGSDVFDSPAAEKDAYRWQQPIATARELIARYCPPDGLVVDPFLGTGTFGYAARQEGRRFVGVELDARRFRTARTRIGGNT
jgi:site-specific DNA-methyltransferase (adenine-specific)